MNIKEVLKKAEEFLARHDIPEPRLDAEVLLADYLVMERIDLYVKFDYPLQEEELSHYRQRLIRRAKHYPVAYITGSKEFMSLDFTINENVLIPRPETEHLVEEVISYCEKQKLLEPNIVDVGTGSGVIMVSLAHYIKEALIVGIDLDENALQVARENINKYDLSDRLKVIRGDLLAPLIKMGKANVNIVVSNPPYIREDEMDKLPPDVKMEPALALNGGQDGLEVYKILIPQAQQVLVPGGLLALEIGMEQAEEVREIFHESDGWTGIEVKQDYSGRDRIITAKRVN